MKLNKEKKEWLTVITCLGSFGCGWGLTVAGFCVPPTGVVSESVLFILGQALLYCGSILGISEHYSAKVKQFESEIKDRLK